MPINIHIKVSMLSIALQQLSNRCDNFCGEDDITCKMFTSTAPIKLTSDVISPEYFEIIFLKNGMELQRVRYVPYFSIKCNNENEDEATVEFACVTKLDMKYYSLIEHILSK